MTRRVVGLALAIILGWGRLVGAAPTAIVSFDTGDESAESIEGGTAGDTVLDTDERTGLYALRVTPASNGTAYHDVTFSSGATQFGRAYMKVATEATEGRVALGFHGSSFYGCRVDREADGTYSLRLRDRTTYEPFGFTSAVSANAYHALEIYQVNQTPGCAGNGCSVLCSLWVDGVQVISGSNDNVAATDYAEISKFRLGASESAPGTYSILYDDVKTDDASQVGRGREFPITPDADGAPIQWNNSCSTTKYKCLWDFATGPNDGATTTQRESVSGNKTTVRMTDITLQSGESVVAVVSFGYAKEVSDDTRDWRLNQCDGETNPTTCKNGPTESPGAAAFVMSSRLTRVLAVDDLAWTEAKVDNLSLQLEHRTNTGNIDVTAVMAVVDIREPDPATAQNLQDWSGDQRLTLCPFGDSRTAGTGLGTCSGNCQLSCSTNNDCTLWGAGVCLANGKYPSILAGVVTQKIGTKSTTVLNCGINGNTSQGMLDRVGGLISGVGLVTKRYCQLSMPTECAPDAGCSGTICGSNDCVNEANGGADCAMSCSLVMGSRICNGGSNDTNDCGTDADCPGGSCSSFPGCDYIFPWADINDVHDLSDASCSFANSKRPPCPPIAAATAPAATPTPSANGGYVMPRVLCGENAECAFGRCANDFAKACNADGDCPGSTCSTSAKIIGTTYCLGVCSNDATRTCGGFCSNNNASCTVNADCTGGGTCNLGLANLGCLGTGTCTTSAKVCSGSCAAIPCTTNDRPDGTSSECGPATFRLIRDDETATMYGICSAGRCSSCGPSGGTSDTQYASLRKTFNGERVIANLKVLQSKITAAGRRAIFIASTPIHQLTTLFGWAGGVQDVLRVRNALLQAPFENVVDGWRIGQTSELTTEQPRCSNLATRTCASNADCPGSCACVTQLSALRAVGDEVHLNNYGARSLVGNGVWPYLAKLHPVCSEDTTTGCGECHDGSVFKGTSCTISTDCSGVGGCTSNGQNICKCKARDSICSDAGKGSCTKERAGNLCTETMTACSSNADCATAADPRRCRGGDNGGAPCSNDSACPNGYCAPNSTCRPEGLPAVGAR